MKKMLLLLLCLCCLNVFAESEKVWLDSCVDGDTARFIYQGQKAKFRFLAIDTPESVHPTKGVEAFGKEASDYACKVLKEAKDIIIQFDDGSNKKDKYDRYLAWVWIDGELLQKDLIEKGYAKVSYIYGDYLYTNSLCQIQDKAIKLELGIWSNEETEVGYCSSINYDEAEEIIFNDKEKGDIFLNEEILEKKYPYVVIVLGVIILIIKKLKKNK